MKSHVRSREENCIIVMLATCSFKWIFEGRFSFSFLEAALLAVGLLQIVKRYVRINFGVGLWVLAVAYIWMSMLINGTTAGNIIKAAVFSLTVMYLVFADYSKININTVSDFIEKIGLFYAVFVFLHFILKENFNALYFPLLSPYNQIYAYAYYRGGRYFGLQYSPHELAGLLVFSIMLVVFRMITNNKIRIKELALLGVFLLALILTGKRGILAIGAVAIVAMVLIFYHSQKKWLNNIKILSAICLLGAIFIFLMNIFPDSSIFYRINKMFDSFSRGVFLDKERRALYKLAIDTWKQNPVFGIGWRNFTFLTIDNPQFALGHQVNCDYLQWLCELGTVGFGICISAVIINLKNGIWLCGNLNRINNDTKKKSALFGIAIQFFIIMYAFIEVPFYNILFFGFYILSCIIINGICRELKVKGTLNE
ncbi:MAG: O-antigen ligase family protein [Butyrivibrio sp.]|nr:O-antigen ligase family protein [Butyrivibrio sp.]